MGRRDYEPKPQVYKVDARDAENDIAGEHDTPTDDTINQIH
jgi:hypothetical protein